MWLKKTSYIPECFWWYVTEFLKLAESSQRVKLFLSLTSGVSLECDEEYLKISLVLIESVGDFKQLIWMSYISGRDCLAEKQQGGIFY